MSRRTPGPVNSLMQVAAAVVGSAAAAQVIAPDLRCSHGEPVVEESPSVFAGAAPVRTYADGCQSYGPYAGEAAQAAEHTYQTDLPQGAYGNGHPAQQDIVGANGRRLILRWVPEGVYVGGCLITDREVAASLARFITREDES